METLKDKIIKLQDEIIELLQSSQYFEVIEAIKRKKEELSRLKDGGEDKLTCTDKCRWFNIGYGHCNFCIRQVKEHDCRDNFEPAEQSDKLTAEDVLKDFISKCRDYSCYSSDINKKRYSFTVAQLCELMEAYHSQFVGEKVTDEMIEKDITEILYRNASYDDEFSTWTFTDKMLDKAINEIKALRDGKIK